MRKLTWKLLVCALLGVSLAFANKPSHPNSVHRYAYNYSTNGGQKYYVIMDLTLYDYTKGIDYDCYFSYNICTFLADPFKIHEDVTGTWFYTSDIPTSGIDWTGLFELSYY